jgi:hypothetical protein
MSEITIRIEQYHDGGSDWPTLRDWLVNHRYVTPVRYDDPRVGPLDERDWDFPYVDGSGDELQNARTYGLLTNAEYFEVLQLLTARHRNDHPRP